MYKISIKYNLCFIASSRTTSSIYLPSSLSHIDLSMVLKNISLFTHNPTTNLICDRESVSSLKAFNTADFLYHSLYENCRTSTPDPNQYLLILDNHIISRLRQDLMYHFLQKKQKNNSLNNYIITHNRKFDRLGQTTTKKRLKQLQKWWNWILIQSIPQINFITEFSLVLFCNKNTIHFSWWIPIW